MKRHRFEIVLGAVLIAVFFAFSAWQSARKLSPADVDHYDRLMEKGLPQEVENRAEFIARMRAWAEADDGQPIYMLNLMRYYAKLLPIPGAPTSGTPAEANAQYEAATTSMLFERASYPMVGGNTTKIAKGSPKSNLLVLNAAMDNWDRIIVVRYPGRRNLINLLTSPEYLKVMPLKLAALEDVFVPYSGQYVFPDMRWVVGAALLCIFLLVGWLHAVRKPQEEQRG